MRRVKRGFFLILCLAVLTCTLTGCYRKAGDFKVEKKGDSYTIMDLSKEGYQKKELVIYNKIGDYDIRDISFPEPGLIFVPLISKFPPMIRSVALEVIYFVDYVPTNNSYFFARCYNLKKIVRIRDAEYDLQCEAYTIYPSDEGASNYSGSHEVNQYVRYSTYLKCCNDEDLFFIQPANISYFYNYENADNEGYYWLDNFDYGTKITYIPPEPTREGYTFDGWYKEEDCINKWDFETDTLPEAILDEEGEPVYQETKLYAKWIPESF